MTIEITEFADKHLSAVSRLLNESSIEQYEFIPFDEERVLSQIKRRHLKILVAEENGRVCGLIASHSHENSEEDITWLVASKEHDRKAIEDVLLTALERHFKANTLITMIDEGNPRIAEWISRGYTLQPGFQRMSAKLTGSTPVPIVDAGTILRSLRVDEEEQLVEAVNKGFGWKRLEHGDLATWKSEDPPFTEEWIQVAEIEGTIVSVVVPKPDTDSNKYLHIRRGYLGPAATVPEFRGKHLASALTVRSMNLLFQKGMDSARLGTSEQNVSSIALLNSLGFEVDSVRKILQKKMKNPEEAEHKLDSC